MKILSLTLLFATSLNWATSPNEREYVQDQNTLEIKTPSLSCRKTAKIRLNNGLEAYLISDPKADQSAAAFAMEAGSWSDSPEYPGVAHFLEHLLFMGSKAYPEENTYTKQVLDNGGIFNAYTAPDRTVYTFSINNNAFSSTLDMFSHMFIDPLFTPSGITRELHAVDQEHDKNIENDGNRLWMILKETGNPSHPNALFSTGNAETLGGIPREEVIKWHHNNYSSDKAHLILYSILPIEELERLTIHHFSAVPQKNTYKPNSNQNLFSNEQKSHIIAIKPIKDLRSLTISWEVPKEYLLDLGSSSHSLLSYILGSKQNSSLYAQLKKEELIENISAGLTKGSKDCGFYSVNFQLTSLGATQFEVVIERCFQVLNALKQTGIPPYIFNEMKTMACIDYQYQSRTSPFNFVSQYADDMIDEPLETFPQKTLIPTQFNPEQTSTFLQNLNPENATYFLIAAPELTGISPDKKEKWSGAEYTTRKISPDSLSIWSEAPKHPNISIPEQNYFIPNSLHLVTQNKEAPSSVTPHPLLISDPDSDYGRVYLWGDSQYHVPEISWIFNIQSPLINSSSKSTVLLDLYRYALNEKLAHTLSYASAASLFVSSKVNDLKLTLAINGYSEKAPLLLEEILSKAKSLRITKEEFDLYLASLKSNYSNVGKAMPIMQAQEILNHLTSNIHPKHNEKIAVIESLTYEDFLVFCKKLFQEAYIEAMLSGNMTKKNAHVIWDKTRDILDFKPYPKEDHEKKQMLLLSPFQGPYKVRATTESLGNAAILVLQEGPFSFDKKASTSVLGAALKEDFFDTLRTKQQTAYIAMACPVEDQEQLYKLFMVQSSTHHPDELIARFELFLETYVKEFDSMIPEGRFEVLRNNLITLLSTPPANLPKMAGHLNEFAFFQNGDFEKWDKTIQALKNLSYETLKKDTITLLSRKNSKRIAILLEGKQKEDKTFRYEDISMETLKAEGSYISLP